MGEQADYSRQTSLHKVNRVVRCLGTQVAEIFACTERQGAEVVPEQRG